jgi:hypothetical protein
MCGSDADPDRANHFTGEQPMSYSDNLRGVMQTKLDALNAMDHFRTVAQAGRAGASPVVPSAPPADSPVKRIGGVVAAGAAVVAALAWLSTSGRRDE